MERKPPEPKKGAPEYMNTYGDMVTLLLCFFVLLFAMSTTDAKKFQSMVESFKGSLGVLSGGKTPSPEKVVTNSRMESKGTEFKYKKIVEKINEEIKQKIEKNMSKEEAKKMMEQIEIRQSARGIEITFGSSMLFESGKSRIKEDALNVLESIGEQLRGLENDIVVEGHTDNIPINTGVFPSNWELSTNRATNVLKYIVQKEPSILGRISAAGYADTISKADNGNEEGRQLNRRVQIIILKSLEERVIEKNNAEGGN
jgi:chemotaxis protein MotB